MNKKIQAILEELYSADPSLKGEEARLIPIVQKLLQGKEEISMDCQFKSELRQKLLEEEVQKTPVRKKRVWIVPASMAAAAVLAIALFLPTMTSFFGDKNQESVSSARSIPAPAEVRMSSADQAVSVSEPEMVLEETEKKEVATDLRLARDNSNASNSFNTEDYDRIYENQFLDAMENPLSTFSIDVDTASYANVRRFLNQGILPPPDAVRIEEMINYFPYDLQGPEDSHPFSIHTQISQAPWNEDNLLLKIGIQGKKISFDSLPPNNLVFLLDVSGSMNDPGKLPLLKNALKMVVNNMREQDRIAIVVYAGAAGTVLEPTGGDNRKVILSALDKLVAGGSTAGAAGIQLAYNKAQEHFDPAGNNRIILATDGDFNVGVSSEGELVRLIEEKRESGIYLTVLGFGSGNLKDSKMEMLADKGNGNYAYIDSLMEARKVLVEEMGGTFFTIAEDVKLQLEFNPAQVKSYRLIGYENRMLAREDFDDDQKDAGELGAGHTVIALYEMVPADGSDLRSELKYQTSTLNDDALSGRELLTVNMRYKNPGEDASVLLGRPVENIVVDFAGTDEDFRFASSVAMWGMLLRDSEFKGSATYEKVLEVAQNAKGDDLQGYRSEFIRLVSLSSELIQDR